MYLMLQHDEPGDFVIATGESHSVREFVEKAFREVDIEIVWEGVGLGEVGRDLETGKVLIQIDHRYFRPTEVDYLLGDPSKAKEKLGWESEVSLDELVRLMVREDIRKAERDDLLKKKGFQVYHNVE
jgi:GDPmannose 4,6-dehydratase